MQLPPVSSVKGTSVGEFVPRAGSTSLPDPDMAPSGEIFAVDGGPLTMSSREIATLTGKEHKNVLTDIRNMLEQLGEHSAEYSAEFSAQYQDSTGRSLPCFNLPKDLTLTLISGYNVRLRHRIVTRWQELESRAPATPAITGKAPVTVSLTVTRKGTKVALSTQCPDNDSVVDMVRALLNT